MAAMTASKWPVLLMVSSGRSKLENSLRLWFARVLAHSHDRSAHVAHRAARPSTASMTVAGARIDVHTFQNVSVARFRVDH